MDFQYRGTTYQTTPLTLERLEKQLIGQYRGQKCYRSIYDTSSLHQVRPLMIYRGVTYDSKTISKPISTEQDFAFKIQVTDQQKPIRSSRHQVMSELDQVHNQFLLKKLDQRLSAAHKKGDRDLVQMLEREKTQLQ